MQEDLKARYPLAHEVVNAETETSLAKILAEPHPLYAASQITSYRGWSEDMYQWLHTEVEEGRAGWYKAGGTKTEVYWWFGWKLDWTSVDQTGLIFGRQRTGEEANMMMGKKRTALVHFFSDKAYSNDAWSHPTPLGTLDILDKPDALRKVPDGAPRGKSAVWNVGVLPYSSDNVKIAIVRFFYLNQPAGSAVPSPLGR